MNKELKSIVVVARGIGILAFIAALFVGQEIIIPLILAMLFSFFLAPTVQWLERRKVPRALAAIVVAGVAFSCVALVGWAVLSELVDMTTNGSRYAQPLTQKFLNLQSLINQQFRAFGLTFQLSGADIMSAGTMTLAPHFMTTLVIISVVAVLTCIMLVHREDIRDRILRLMGERNVLTSTALLDQAGTRLSRFLALALGMNLSYALLFGLLLYFLGVPNPIVWAAAVIVLRFLPHIGVILCVLPPAAMLFATTPGWEMPATLILSAVALDLFFTNVFEPLTYGSRMGVSTLPLFIATIFWVWLWGLPGLALATPITICLTVLGRMVPKLRIFSVVFDVQSPLEPGHRLCQRLIVGDMRGAQALWENPENTDKIDTFVVPCLEFLKANKEVEGRDPDIEARIFSGLTDLLQTELSTLPQPSSKRVVVVYRHSDLGRLLALAACASLTAAGYGVRLLSSRKLPTQKGLAAWLTMNGIEGVLITSYGLSGTRFVRFISKRLRVAGKRLPVVVYNPNAPVQRIESEPLEHRTESLIWSSKFAQVMTALAG